MLIHDGLPTTLQSSAKIRFQDCDPFGHLNNARYIDYFMNARTDQIAAHYDLHIMEYGKTPTESWVVTKNQIAYLAPAFLAEDVTIQTRIIHLTDSQILVEGLMLGQGERRLKAVCWMEFTYVSLRQGKIAVHPDDVAKLLSSVHYENSPDALDFDARVRELKAQYRKAAVVE